MAKINIKNFTEAANGSGGIQAIVAAKLKVSRTAISYFIRRIPKMKELLEKEREKIIDKAESELFKAADNGEKWAIERILKTIGKDRGYTEKIEIEQKTEHTIKSARDIYNEVHPKRSSSKKSNKR